MSPIEFWFSTKGWPAQFFPFSTSTIIIPSTVNHFNWGPVLVFVFDIVCCGFLISCFFCSCRNLLLLCMLLGARRLASLFPVQYSCMLFPFIICMLLPIYFWNRCSWSSPRMDDTRKVEQSWARSTFDWPRCRLVNPAYIFTRPKTYTTVLGWHVNSNIFQWFSCVQVLEHFNKGCHRSDSSLQIAVKSSGQAEVFEPC